MESPKTVEELIRQSCDPKYRLGSGAFGTGYSLDHVLGLEPYVMRVSGGGSLAMTPPSELLRDRLKETTALTPPPSILGSINLGQRLIQSDNKVNGKPLVSFALRQSGLSLQEWLQRTAQRHQATGHRNSMVQAYLDLNNAVLAATECTGQNPFTPLYEMEPHLERAGFKAQLDSTNILWDEKVGQLRLVDQTHYTGEGAFANNLRYRFMPESRYRHECPTPLWEELKQKHSAVVTLIDAAELGQTITEAKGEDPAPFTMVNPVSTKGIALSDPPQALIERLRELHAETDVARTV